MKWLLIPVALASIWTCQKESVSLPSSESGKISGPSVSPLQLRCEILGAQVAEAYSLLPALRPSPERTRQLWQTYRSNCVPHNSDPSPPIKPWDPRSARHLA